jgi:hypothetical protein
MIRRKFVKNIYNLNFINNYNCNVTIFRTK